jgi:hypothetical protein
MAKNCKNCKFKLMATFVEPTLDELKAFAKQIGFNPFDAEYFIVKNRSVGWIDNQGRPYRDWKSVAQLWMRGAMSRGEILADNKKTFRERLSGE